MTNPIGTIRKIKEDFLTCGICLENLDKPKCLTCLHKFCADCLQAYVASKGVTAGHKFQCPYKCNEKTVWPKNGSLGLKTDYTLQGLIEYLQRREREEEQKQSVTNRMRSPLPPLPPQDAEKSNDDLKNLYQALWKTQTPAPSGGEETRKPCTNLESLFDDSNADRSTQGWTTTPPTLAPRSNVTPGMAPPAIPPRAKDNEQINRTNSETHRRPLYPQLPGSQSFDSFNTTQADGSSLEASAPDYQYRYSAGSALPPSRLPPQGAPAAPPPFNPYYGSENPSSIIRAINDQALPNQAPDAGRAPRTVLKKLKDKFKIELIKTPAPQGQPGSSQGQVTREVINPSDMTYEDLKKVAIERSLQDKGPIRQGLMYPYQPEGMGEEQAYILAMDESRWHQRHVAGLEDADNDLMYDLAKQLSLEESREPDFLKLTLEEIPNAEFLDTLNIKQMKFILETSSVDYKQSASMYELRSRVKSLWDEFKYRTRPLPPTPAPTPVYDHGNNDAAETYDDITEVKRAHVTSQNKTSPDSTMFRPIRSVVGMKLPAVPCGQQPANKSPVTPEAPFLPGRPLPEVPNEHKPSSSNNIPRRDSSKRSCDRLSISSEEAEYCSTEDFRRSTSRPSDRPSCPPPPPPPAPSDGSVSGSDEPEPEANYTNLTGTRSHEQRAQDNPGSRPDRYTHAPGTASSGYKDPVSSLAEALRSSLGKRASNNQQSVCTGCGEPIPKGTRHTIVKDRKFHIDCFRCKTCRSTIEGASFYDEPEFPTCTACHESLAGKRCSKCKKIAVENVTWDGKIFHKTCFTCFGCDKLLQSEKVYKESSRPYCTLCYMEEFASTCIRCRRPILAGVIKISMERSYHKKCLTCVSCGSALSGLRIYSKGKGDDVTCNSCYK